VREPTQIHFYPPLDPARREILAPIDEVTVLEDRALVTRRARVLLPAGPQRLRVMEVAPVLQDVSLRAEVTSGDAALTDLRARRCLRVQRDDLPEEARAIERAIEEVFSRFEDAQQDQRAATDRYRELLTMLTLGLVELPTDAAWGRVDPQGWSNSLQTLSNRARVLLDAALEHHFTQQDLLRELDRLQQARALADHPGQRAIACLELDLEANSEGPVSLEMSYVVPGALWRPTHRAQLVGESLRFTAQAALWQRTGEEWPEVKLVFSTARASLGTDPPLLSDDLLQVQRRREQVVVSEREVEIQRHEVEGAGAEPAGEVQLPGVDDGGEVRSLRPASAVTVRGDGQPHFVALYTFEAPAQTSRLCLPEVSPQVILRAAQRNGGPGPILAGPVELVRDSGPVGWTRVGFVAPGAPFELGFGPQDELRVQRVARALRDEVDAVDKWRRQRFEVELFVSNLSEAPREVELTERVPVSEIEHVKVRLLDEESAPLPRLDEDGFCRWSLSLEGHGRQALRLRYEIATAPGVVQG
jgi:uncharacterized protein (TIGR02231 family)